MSNTPDKKKKGTSSASPPELMSSADVDLIERNRMARMKSRTGKHMLGENTPGRRKNRSEVWKFAKRIRGEHPALKMKGAFLQYTHQCLYVTGKDEEGNDLICNTLLKCGHSTDHYKDIDVDSGDIIKTQHRKWLTTKVIDHFEVCHPTHQIAFARIQRKASRAVARVAAMAQGAIPPIVVKKKRPFVPTGGTVKPEPGTYRDARPLPSKKYVSGPYYTNARSSKVLAAQVKSYIYCKGRLSKSQLDDEWFRRALKETATLDTEHLAAVLKEIGFTYDAKVMLAIEKSYNAKNQPTLRGPAVKEWVESEFELFRMFLKPVVSKCQVECLGNQIGQAIHDCGTLADKHKYMALGMQVIMPGWDRNMPIALSMRRMESGKDAYQAGVIEEEIKRRTGYSFQEIAGSCIQDGAALGVAKELGIEWICCLMHDGDNVR